MHYIAQQLRINGTPIESPSQVPTGGIDTLQTIIKNGFNIAIIFLIIFALGSTIWSGIQIIQSGGDKQKLQNGKSRLIYSIIGLIIVFMSFFIINVLGFVLGGSFFG